MKYASPILVAIVLGCTLITGCGITHHASAAAPKLVHAVPSSTLQWETDWDSAMRAAKAEHKPLMVDLYTSWCGWCKVLDSKVFPDKRVVAASDGYVAIRLDAEKTEAGYELATHFGVHGFPSIIFLDPDGTSIGFVDGFLPANELSAQMLKFSRDYQDYPSLQQKVKSNPGDVVDGLRLADIEVHRGNPEVALAIANSLSKAAGPESAAPAFNTIADYDSQQGSYADAIRLYRQTLTSHCSTKDIVIAHVGLVKIYAGQRMLPETRSELHVLIDLPGAPDVVKTHARQLLHRIDQSDDPA
jgi:thioredoxin-related protein